MTRVLICVDDTDDLTKETSTGAIADMICEAVVGLGGRLNKGVTRHQLLLHNDIAYTSHNSSMCMDMTVDKEFSVEKIETEAKRVILENMADTSDPGLCICRLDELKFPARLISFGKRAQLEVLDKAEAYRVADEIGGTLLKEHGGDGSGVIGALAGVGLRLMGSDGTFRGGKEAKYAGSSFSVKEWLGKEGVEQVLDTSGNALDEKTQIHIEDRIKFALLNDKKTLVAKERKGNYYGCDKKILYGEDRKIDLWLNSCHLYIEDNDREEQITKEVACYNCLYRRWTPRGYDCARGK
ncbi:MAG: hypothetical protein ACOYJU_07745 [Anaerovoracaceae bacterium]